MQNSADNCPVSRRSNNAGNVALYLIEIEFISAADRKANDRCRRKGCSISLDMASGAVLLERLQLQSPRLGTPSRDSSRAGYCQIRTAKWSAITLRAEPIQKELVPGRTKAARQLRLERWDAPFKLIQFLALVALEVMVMCFPGYLVACRIAWNFYRLQPALIDQRLDVSINGRYSKGWVMKLRALPGLFRGERPVSFGECFPNGRFLPCLSLIHERKKPSHRLRLSCVDSSHFHYKR
jgi:hypothetical protein